VEGEEESVERREYVGLIPGVEDLLQELVWEGEEGGRARGLERSNVSIESLNRIEESARLTGTF